MMCSPQERKAVLEMIARMALDEIRSECGGDLRGLVILPLATVAPLVGLTVRTARETLPVTEISEGKHGVTMRAMEAHIAGKTRTPRNTKL